jgi:hypothetical protein
MSAALLQNTAKPNELEDDRESCLHVLTWMVLCYTELGILNDTELGNSNVTWRDLLRPFDEAYKAGDVVKGGIHKQVSLTDNNIPDLVKFNDRPHLDALIEELTKTFAFRYKKPTEDDFKEFDELEATGLHSEKLLAADPVFKYRDRMSSLQSRGWLVKTFRHHLAGDPWPTSDKPVEKDSEGEVIEPSAKRRRTGGV